MGVDYTILADNSDMWDTPTDGEFRMYDGGTTLDEARRCPERQGNDPHAGALHREDTRLYQGKKGQEVVAFNRPIGVAERTSS